ncbi:protein FAR-RED IMPAIRED RESPONSE 1 [Dorcoceras hygrometricum]|uniref:Protein FAR-RED IMPAIRED RESPONSE 1 n=1 Tax=Dorcoceras hygrometricum TaxID=472368 RepID=A0A2Z7CGK8_9LAMI|nr:protein FAR-RED IMPAIRED RESPONSE 1 [Dorcoceras hygrometricum]
MTFRVVRTNQYNQDLGLIHSTNGNHLESPNEGSSIDHQVTIHLHAQNITMFSPARATVISRKIQQMRRDALDIGMSCDDISLDVITISSWLSVDDVKRKSRCDVVLRFSR